MKTSIEHLPESTQEELAVLKELILKYIPRVRMIILFGSYARGNYTLWEEGEKFGSHYTHQSDLDIMVVTEELNAVSLEAKAHCMIMPRYEKRLPLRRHSVYMRYPAPYPEILVESTKNMDLALQENHFFYSDIVREGILIYDDGKFRMPKPQKLSYYRVKEIAQADYDENYPDGCDFLSVARFAKEQQMYRIGSFNAHQACERFYKVLMRVFINYRPQYHKLEILRRRTKKYSDELWNVFSKETKEEKDLFKKLCDAYIRGRYDLSFKVSEEELDWMIDRAKALQDITKRLCEERFAFYDEKIKEENE
ncbi:HEPN domain-containing protein [Bacteroides sp.]